MATAISIDLNDFTCSICHEIFENPVILSCSHCYCEACVTGLQKPLSSSSSETTPPTTSLNKSVVYAPKLRASEQCFVCAICRNDSFGYSDCREIELDLQTLEAPCSHCKASFALGELRKHQEICVSQSKITSESIRKTFTPEFFMKLSQSQSQALETARVGENRSTFQCPYCYTPNFTVESLCKHIEAEHITDDHRRVCPVCASMPWGNKNKISRNVYHHLVGRHRFNYDTYVNFDQDEETMIAEAVERSMLYK